MILNPLKLEFNEPGNFREQIAPIYIGSVGDEVIQLVRSYDRVCLPGLASFDTDKPGSDSAAGWEYINDIIDNHKGCGVFHTHPPRVDTFSGRDWMTMRAFALANGKKYLWYGVQACDSPTAHFICMNMLGGKIFCYDYGQVFSRPDDIAVNLPLPMKIEYLSAFSDMYRLPT